MQWRRAAKFQDRYEEALKNLLKKKQAGEKIAPAKPPKPSNVVNLMEALKRSVEAERSARPAGARRPLARRHARKRGTRPTGRRRAS